ncbi:Calx-beta domain-containing protein [Phenylobacterium sp.]|jgi:Ca2+-binding RTX toxin-like protein|uniref:Calx-beta domain-containing protein n=1 Tax=Phenylobacterium sp. TaxID=1871053 RepID=UPI0037850794
MPTGSDGDDLLSGNAGGQTLDGGPGNDTASYASATTGVMANLASGTVAFAPRIMPLGDSITFGVQWETAGGYRGPLWDLTVANDLAINFVGSVVGGNIEDADNEGHPGWTIDQMDANVATWIAAANPDVVLLIAGTNNTKGNPLPTATQILNKLSRLIDDIAAQPNAPRLFVGPIPPMTDDQPATRIALAQAYNAMIPDLIAQKRTAGIDVTYVDMSDLTPADITAPPHDPGLHPNPSGYTKIAANWYEALATRLGGDNGGLSRTASDQLISIENLEGSAYRDVLIGDGGANRLVGLGGGDLLNGGSGADTMIGGLGDDTYYVDHAGDQVVERAGEGRDTVRTIFTSVGLAANIENLTFVGSGSFAGTGNELANLMTGGSGADTLSGGMDSAIDTLVGGAGDDVYIVMAGDLVNESAGAGRDRVRTDLATYILRAEVEELVYTGAAAFKGFGNASDNLIIGGDGNDALNGLAGADTLLGGAGGDSYTVDNVGDVVSEVDAVNGGDAGGTDTVKTTLTSYTLGSYIEKLTFIGLDAAVGFQGTGNGLVNKITGGPGDDTLSGGADGLKDTLVGGAGDDTYIVQVGDVVTENADAGQDRVQTALSTYVLPVNVEELVFTGVGGFNGSGNSADNLMSGGAGADTLSGGLGADTITGGAGVDTIAGSRAELNGDLISDYDGDRIVLSQSLASAANVQLDLAGSNALLRIDGDNNGVFETVITLQGAVRGQLEVESANGFTNNVLRLGVPSLSLAATNAVKAEGNSGSTAFTFTVTRSGDLSGPATVDWTVSGSGLSPADSADFGGALPSGQVSFAAGEAAKVVTVQVAGDTVFEPDEAFTVTLSNPSGGATTQATAVGSIVNDDPAASSLSLAATSATHAEGNSGTAAYTFTVTRSGDLSGPAAASWTVSGTGASPADAADFGGALPSGQVNFAAGETSKVITFNVAGDTAFEPDENFTVTLFNATSNTAIIQATAVGSITNDDVFVLTGTSGADALNGGADGDTIQGLGGNDKITGNGGDDVVDAGDGADTVTGGDQDDFILGGAGDDVLKGNNHNDTLVGGAGTDSLTGSSGLDVFRFESLDGSVDVITDFSGNDKVELDLLGLGVTGGQVVFVNGLSTSTANQAALHYVASTGALYIDLNGGDTADAVQFATLSNKYALSLGSFSFINGGAASPMLSLAAASATRAEGNSGLTTLTFTVTRSGDLSGVTTVDWAVSGSGASAADAADFGGALPSGQVSFAAGEASKTISVYAAGDTVFEANEGFTVTLSNPTGGAITQATASGSITNDDAAPSLSVAAANAVQAEGNSGSASFTFAVTRTGDLSGSTTVSWAVSGSGASPANAADFGGALPSGQVSFATGESSKVITLDVAGDTAYEPDEGFTVTLSNPSAGFIIAQATAAGSITNDDDAPAALSLAATSAIHAEGDSGATVFTFTVTRSGDLSGAATADWVVSGSGASAADAADFGGSLPSGQVSFAAGETSKVITFDVAGDTAFEPDEGFTITLSNPTGSIVTQATASGSITNDDGFVMLGTSGPDLLSGGAVGDTVQGLAGDDKIFGNGGDDVLDGDDGADTVSGGDQDDLVRGGAGDDILKGNNHNDTLVGGAGSDNLTGSSGLDVFRFERLDGGIDVITDFSGNDKVELDLLGMGVSGSQVLFVNGLGPSTADVAALHYVASTGALYLDLNGGDAADAVQFATLSNKYALSLGSFLLN